MSKSKFPRRPMPKSQAEDILARLCAAFPLLMAQAHHGASLEASEEIVGWLEDEFLALLGTGSRLERLLVDRSERGTPTDEHGDPLNWRKR